MEMDLDKPNVVHGYSRNSSARRLLRSWDRAEPTNPSLSFAQPKNTLSKTPNATRQPHRDNSSGRSRGRSARGSNRARRARRSRVNSRPLDKDGDIVLTEAQASSTPNFCVNNESSKYNLRSLEIARRVNEVPFVNNSIAQNCSRTKEENQRGFTTRRGRHSRRGLLKSNAEANRSVSKVNHHFTCPTSHDTLQIFPISSKQLIANPGPAFRKPGVLVYLDERKALFNQEAFAAANHQKKNLNTAVITPEEYLSFSGRPIQVPRNLNSGPQTDSFPQTSLEQALYVPSTTNQHLYTHHLDDRGLETQRYRSNTQNQSVQRRAPNYSGNDILAFDSPKNRTKELSGPLTVAYREVVLWWVRELNKWCDPILDEIELLLDCDRALEASNIVPNTYSLDSILELAFNRIVARKKTLYRHNPQYDLLPLAKLRLAKQAEKRFGVPLPQINISLPVSIAIIPSEQKEDLSRTNANMAVSAPLLRQFIGLINGAIGAQNGETLKKLLPIEPPLAPDYLKLLDEAFSQFSNVDTLKEALKSAIRVVAKEDKDAWQAFPDFIVTWLTFIRTVNVENLLDTYDRLSGLLR
jgi:hypothetical protein